MHRKSGNIHAFLETIILQKMCPFDVIFLLLNAREVLAVTVHVEIEILCYDKLNF